MRRLADSASFAVAAAAAALVILAVAVLPFLTPAWVSFEQGRADAAGWIGYSAVDLRTATDAILADLVVGPPVFDVTIGGEPVLTESERSHMQDVRRVFTAFFVGGGVGLAILVAGWLTARGNRFWSRARFLQAVRAGAVGLGVGIAITGIIATIGFDAAFEVFHRLFFAAGTYTFDPRSDRLVQLFPEAFWSDTTIAVGVVTVVLALIAVSATSRRLRRDHQAAPIGALGAVR